MRKWLWIGTLAVTLASVVGYGYLTTKLTVENALLTSLAQGRVIQPGPLDKDDGNGEMSEAVEPLIVGPGAVRIREVPVDNGQVARVFLEPGMQQPSRPDAGQGKGLRMPYADEEEFFSLPFDPVQRILDLTLPRLNLFEELNADDPAEESEPRQAVPMPMPNYHHHHSYCPYSGHCPAPIPLRR